MVLTKLCKQVCLLHDVSEAAMVLGPFCKVYHEALNQPLEPTALRRNQCFSVIKPLPAIWLQRRMKNVSILSQLELRRKLKVHEFNKY